MARGARGSRPDPGGIALRPGPTTHRRRRALSTGGGEAWPADGLGPADDRRGDSLCWIARHGFYWTDRLPDCPTCLD